MLSTGTVSGVAGFKSPEERARLYLKPGDVIEAEIERIGVLRNPVISWQEGHGDPAAASYPALGRRLDASTENPTAATARLRGTHGRPVTLFTGQWADLPWTICQKASEWGYDGIELACWGDHFDVAEGR